MMTTEYCPATEIQRMEQELWTLTLKGDDIEAYNNHFHELALMCLGFVPTEKKKIGKGGVVRTFKKNDPKAGTIITRELVREHTCGENPQAISKCGHVTILLNEHYLVSSLILGTKKRFVSFTLHLLFDIALTSLNTSYEVELADGKVVSTNTVLRSCTLVLLNHVFKIDLLPTRLGSFDVIVGMDWLSYHRAVIDCYEKIVRIPLPNGEILEVQARGWKRILDH
ncbi:putative reverse transcriptase domain-containing protein [Tanacetum coccineum]